MEDAVRFRIVRTAHQLFVNRGYRNVTIQDLASELGMSKKTIYQHVNSKEEIAEAVIKETMQQISGHIDSSTISSGNPLEILRQTLGQIKEEILRLSPLFLDDIQKVVPELWDQITRFRSEKARFVGTLITEAQEKGLIKKSINPQIATALFLESLQALVRPEVWTRHGFTADELIGTLFNVFIDGLTDPNYGSNR
jgi:AcrR family transcriptional regulator